MVYNGNIWVNFITISLSSLEIMVNKGNHPQMGPFAVMLVYIGLVFVSDVMTVCSLFV